MLLRCQPDYGTMKTLGTRLREARKLRTMSQTELARRTGISPNQISMIEGGQSGTSIRTMVAAGAALNVSLDYLTGQIENPTTARDLLYALDEAQARIIDLEQGRRDFFTSDYLVEIKVMDITSGAGDGRLVGSETATSKIQFPGSWITERGLTPEKCRVIGVTGESMEPTLTDGCSIIVELGRRRRQDRRIYVIRIDNELIVKRAVHDREAGWLIVSDNPNKEIFPTRAWPDDATIVGEVKWYGQSFT